MSTKKQISSSCKLYSVYEEIPEKFWTKQTEIVTFITTFWTFHSPLTEQFGLAKDATKSLLHSKCFIFAIQSYSSDLFSRKKSPFPEKQIDSLLDSLGEFLKAFDQANKVLQIQLPKLKNGIGFTKARDELFSHCYKEIVGHLNRQTRLSFRFEEKQDLRLFHQKV